ncbi:endonuclease/exonuclease/phosphatase family protein [Marinobacter bryozoorum]|uniref:endonuclease/exonuclease/phosphatase family protein n=1 Tax=Marinobacter bryozoorum TaxID=256324 RepID=UPI002005796A|nr:endonuclease/exonuclease/phosphatase family protein [Marinobacter bryozoorum]MCK7543151.1 endonuclease/exonuclease/phosphatase family protein [Marinobacter bryozoorum]
MTGLILFGLALVLLVVTVLGKVPVHDWWVRACEFPRVQIATLALILAGLSPLAGGWSLWVLLASLVVLVLQVYRILPWTRIWPLQVQPAETDQEERCFTLMVANVLTPNRDSEGLIRQVREHQPDLLLTLESDQWWGDQLDEAFGDWPCIIRIPLDNLYGMHLYSRLPLEEAEVKYLIQDDIPSIHGWLKLPDNHRVRFHALHPRPPAPSESEESLWRDAELLLVGQEIHESGLPSVVAGDLNDVAWSRTTRLFCKVSGMLDPRRGRGMFSTFHAGRWYLRWPLDHVFTSEHFTVSNIRRLGYFGSDHFPILVTLCYRPSRADEHETPEADAEEQEEARETVREGKIREQET